MVALVSGQTCGTTKHRRYSTPSHLTPAGVAFRSTTEHAPGTAQTAPGLANNPRRLLTVADDTDATASLRAVAEALTIWYELEPRPLVDDGYTPETEAWLERFQSAAVAVAAEAGGDEAALRAAHGPPWDSDEPRPVALALLNAAIGVQR